MVSPHQGYIGIAAGSDRAPRVCGLWPPPVHVQTDRSGLVIGWQSHVDFVVSKGHIALRSCSC